MKKLLSTILVFVVAVVAMFSGAPILNAQTTTTSTCIFSGIPVLSIICGKGSESLNTLGDTTVGIVRIVFTLIFGVIVIVAVFYIVKAALKYIRAEGDEKKIEQAKGGMKSVLMGLAALFVGALGLIVVLVLTNGTSATNSVASDINKLVKCIQNPTSDSCKAGV